MTTFSRSDIASNGETEDPRPKDPKVSSQRVSRSIRPQQTVDPLVQHRQLFPLKSAEWLRMIPDFRWKNIPVD